MKIGDKVWLFDMNRRVYPKNHSLSSQPIFAEHFYKVTIDGETSRSWLIGRNKYPKNNPRHPHVGIYTEEQKADAIWEHENRIKILDKVRYCSIEELKQVDLILSQNKT